MAKAEAVKLTNMCMVRDGKGNVLVQERNDPNWPGLTFPGGAMWNRGNPLWIL